MSEKAKICETCGLDLLNCSGHFGFVKLTLPVYHVGYFKHVVNILQTVCKCCSRVLLTKEDKFKYSKLIRSKKDSMAIEVVRK